MFMDLKIVVYFTLIMSLASLWIHRSPWLWGSFLATSVILAIQAGIANAYSIIAIGSLFVLHFLMTRDRDSLRQIIYFLCITTLSIALAFHWIPFCNWNLSGNLWLN